MDNDSTTTTNDVADIMKQIASQAASVRQNFGSGKRKHSSLATAKAAQQMVARRRTTMEEYQQPQSSGQSTTEQPWRMTSHIFHSHIASYTKSATTTTSSSMPTSSSLAAHHHQPPQQYPVTSVSPRVSDGIILAVSNSVYI